MNIKSFLDVLETVLTQKYPHINFEFYYSCRNRYVHMGLDKIDKIWQLQKRDKDLFFEKETFSNSDMEV